MLLLWAPSNTTSSEAQELQNSFNSTNFSQNPPSPSYALANSFPLPRPQEPTTANNHALLRMMYTLGLLHTPPNPTDSWKPHESSGS
ncbi:hypothetical protein CGCA056_v006321 [Colletotrichum aenigma]|uniref:uncharacterized protein n=1 Tax=Colletotrichum aenigma TaxID=1215731 RepID=UPI0018731F5D|nr:uncharacterized protein CGCA056_v006321 [Colletotrichum aenigma]KAF5521756.1 hypothetical protein CGCA056_v006321 [Colletotrichum aenigma]